MDSWIILGHMPVFLFKVCERIGAQIEWGSMWYISAACSYVKILERILCQAYKVAIGLPKSTPNRVCWKFSQQKSLTGRISIKMDRLIQLFVCKLIQLKNNIIINKIVPIMKRDEI